MSSECPGERVGEWGWLSSNLARQANACILIGLEVHKGSEVSTDPQSCPTLRSGVDHEHGSVWKLGPFLCELESRCDMVAKSRERPRP